MLERRVPEGWGQDHTIQVAPEILKGKYKLTKDLKLPHSVPHGKQSVDVLDLWGCLNPADSALPESCFSFFSTVTSQWSAQSLNITLNRRSCVFIPRFLLLCRICFVLFFVQGSIFNIKGLMFNCIYALRTVASPDL